jgi:Cu(I)-responsive transcriptional regulator
MMNIGQASKFSGVSAKMIRYYEQIGLIPQAIRSDAGYRHYSSPDVHSLRFIRRSRDLGFSVEQISELLILWRDRDRASADVKAMALSHAAGLNAKIAELQAMAQTLEHLANHCHGNDRPDCPILADLAEQPPAAQAEQRSQAPYRAPRFGIDTPASSYHRAAKVTHS